MNEQFNGCAGAGGVTLAPQRLRWAGAGRATTGLYEALRCEELARAPAGCSGCCADGDKPAWRPRAGGRADYGNRFVSMLRQSEWGSSGNRYERNNISSSACLLARIYVTFLPYAAGGRRRVRVAYGDMVAVILPGENVAVECRWRKAGAVCVNGRRETARKRVLAWWRARRQRRPSFIWAVRYGRSLRFAINLLFSVRMLTLFCICAHSWRQRSAIILFITHKQRLVHR